MIYYKLNRMKNAFKDKKILKQIIMIVGWQNKSRKYKQCIAKYKDILNIPAWQHNHI